MLAIAGDQQKIKKAYPKRVRSKNAFCHKIGQKMRFLRKMWAQSLTKAIEREREIERERDRER